MGGHVFTFAYTAKEFREGGRVFSRYAASWVRPRLLRSILLLVELAIGAFTALVVGPAMFGPLTVDQQCLVGAYAFCAVAVGILVERRITRALLRRSARPWVVAAHAEREVRLTQGGIRSTADGRTTIVTWPDVTTVHRGKLLLTFLLQTGEWLGIPRRLVADPAVLEREIATWRAAA